MRLGLDENEGIISGNSPQCQDFVGDPGNSFNGFQRVEEDPIMVELIAIEAGEVIRLQ